MTARNTPKTSPVADAAASFAQGEDRPMVDSKTVALLRADGAASYEGEGALKSFVSAFQPVMKTATQPGDFVLYTELTRQWKIGYEQARQNVHSEGVKITDRSDTAFLRRMREAMSADLGDDRLLGEKPKSESAAAAVKRAQREAAAALVSAAIADKSLVQLNSEANKATKASEAAIKRATKAAEAVAKLNPAASKLERAKAEQALADAREEAAKLTAAAQQAQTWAETKKAKIEREEAEKAAKELKEFRDHARKLVAEANKVQVLQVIQLLESQGVITAEARKAKEDAAKAQAAQAAQAVIGKAAAPSIHTAS